MEFKTIMEKKMNTNTKLLITWLFILPLIMIYGFIEIESFDINIRWFLLAGWIIVYTIGFLISIWKSE